MPLKISSTSLHSRNSQSFTRVLAGWTRTHERDVCLSRWPRNSPMPINHAPTLELHEIQATVLRPRPAPYFGTHVLLRVDDAQAGRAFLRLLTPYVDSAAGSRIAANAWL